jgi:hypothetical protein
MRLNFKSAAIFSDRTAERLTDELYIFSFFVYGVTAIYCWQKRVLNLILDRFRILQPLIYRRRPGRLLVTRVCVWTCGGSGLDCGLSIGL